MNKQLAVHTSYPDNPPKDFNDWQQHLLKERNKIWYDKLGRKYEE